MGYRGINLEVAICMATEAGLSVVGKDGEHGRVVGKDGEHGRVVYGLLNSDGTEFVGMLFGARKLSNIAYGAFTCKQMADRWRMEIAKGDPLRG